MAGCAAQISAGDRILTKTFISIEQPNRQLNIIVVCWVFVYRKDIELWDRLKYRKT